MGRNKIAVEMTPFLIDPDQTIVAVGGEGIYRRMIKAGWIKPVIANNRLTRYLTEEVKAACMRLKFETLPFQHKDQKEVVQEEAKA